jgi:mono/diheme cytochrome c family protein
MRVVMVFAFSLVAATAALGQAAGNERTVWDGVYSDVQAKRGEATYVSKCSDCHDGGVMAPELAGFDFRAEWENKKVGELYRLIHTTMPADAPGDLKEREVFDLIAYVLRANGFPPGDQAIDDVTALDGIAFVGRKTP